MSASIQNFNSRGGAIVLATDDHAATLDALPDWPARAGKAGATALAIGNGLYDCSFQALQLLGFDWTTNRRGSPGQVLSV